jgi:hypothetical protein
VDPGAAWVAIVLAFGAAVGFLVGIAASLLHTRRLYVGAAVVAVGLLDGIVRHDAFVPGAMLLAAFGWPLGSWLQRVVAGIWVDTRPTQQSRTPAD